MRVVRVDDEVWEELKKRAVHLGLVFATPNTVLRKVLGLEEKSKARRQRVPGKLTPQGEFWKPMLEALVEMGGQGFRQEVHEAVERKMEDRLKPGDHELNRADGTTKWSKAVDFQRLKMKHEGLIAANTPRGIWKITEQGRRWLSQH